MAGMGSFLIVTAATAIALIVTLQGNSVDAKKNSKNLSSDLEPFSFDEFLNNKFSAKYFRGSWWSNNELLIKDESGNLVTWNVVDQTSKILVSKDTIDVVSDTAQFVSFAPGSSQYLLFKDKVNSVWRHSFTAIYTILDSQTNETQVIVPEGVSEEDANIQYVDWRPSSTDVVYVYNNDIRMKRIESDGKLGDEIRLTSSGVPEQVYNGIPDWVYEEEVLGTNKAMYFSKSGGKMAYVEFNDEEVKEFVYPKYGNPEDPLSNRYPKNIRIKYPKTGTTNPSIKINVFDDLTSESPSELNVEAPEDLEGYIYTAITWINEDTVSVIWMNRVQNQSEVTECRKAVEKWKCTVLYGREISDGWLDLFQPPVYNKKADQLLQIQPKRLDGPTSERYKHVAQIVKGEDGEEVTTTFLTDGKIAVTSILGWDEENDLIYFIATEEGEPGTRQLYSVAPSKKNDNKDLPKNKVKCVTCNLFNSKTGNETCRYQSIDMSPGFDYYIQNCRGPSIPTSVLRKSSDHSIVGVLESNAELEESLKLKAVPERQHLRVEVPNGFDASVVLNLPNGFDINANKKYPILVYSYGGPGSQQVDYRWPGVGWGEFLVSNYDIVYASIDGRGTGFQSDEYTYQLYKQLGTVEMEDQIGVTVDILKDLSYLDSNRTGIWGWSYGGYLTLMTLMQDKNDVFKCGISTAPPTDWLFYDTMYTERFMRLPTDEDNWSGYDQASLLNKVENLRGKNFMVNHGVADDNVHYQQSMMLARALQLADIQFEENSYPDENHGLGSVSRFLYHRFDSFWSDCFNYESVIKS